MHLILLVVGVLVAAAGVVMLRAAAPLADPGGAALFTSGMIAVVGGLILMGLAAAVHSLKRIAERLEIQPLPLPPVASVEREDPAPRPVRAPAAAPLAGSVRPSLLGWLGRASAPAPAIQAPLPRSELPRVPQGTAQSEAPVGPPPVDLEPLTRVPEVPRVAPAVAAPASSLLRTAPKPVAHPKPAAAANGSTHPTVYRSGVIDGMAYSLFMDGSIEAELPAGKVKFATVDELQKYLVGKQ